MFLHQICGLLLMTCSLVGADTSCGCLLAQAYSLGGLVNWFVGWVIRWIVGSWGGRADGRAGGCLAGWLAGWLFGWLSC